MVYKSYPLGFGKIPHLIQRHCLLCHCPIDTYSTTFGLCSFCQSSLPLLQHSCRKCAIPLPVSTDLCGQCLQKPPLFTAAHCAAKYEGDIPKLIHQLKHFHDKAINRLLTELFLQSLPEKMPEIDLMVPVPMHHKRNMQRGNNHSSLLSLSISKRLHIKHDSRLLQRIKLTETQQGLNARQRRKNLAGVFYTGKDLKGLRIAVIDDVITTASTMNEITSTLQASGALDVFAWAIARTPKNFHQN